MNKFVRNVDNYWAYFVSKFNSIRDQFDFCRLTCVYACVYLINGNTNQNWKKVYVFIMFFIFNYLILLLLTYDVVITFVRGKKQNKYI